MSTFKSIAVATKGTARILAKSGQKAVNENPRKALKVIGLIVGAYLIYRVAKEIFANASSQSEVQTAYNELEALNQNANTKQKLTPFQAKSYANSIFTAMDGYGTDEEGIKQVFYKLQNNADFLAVSKAFGVKEVSSGSYNPEANFKGTMSSALKSELSADWIKILNAILKKKKITYQI